MAGENEFSANTLIESAKANQNFDGAYTGDFDETENSLRTYRDESVFDHIISGGVITDPGASLTQITTAIVALIDGRRVTIGATSKTYTASKDTYVDVLRSGTTASYVYTEVSNNAASPALASSSIRIAIVTTNGTEITNANQGQETQVIPIASNIPYSVTDSLGNLIAPRDPQRRLLGYRQILTDFASATNPVDVTGLSVPVIVPGNRKIKISSYGRSVRTSAGAGTDLFVFIQEGTDIIQEDYRDTSATGANTPTVLSFLTSPSTGLHTYKIVLQDSGGGTKTLDANADYPAFIMVELV